MLRLTIGVLLLLAIGACDTVNVEPPDLEYLNYGGFEHRN
jgi:hypothetical protein